MLVLQQKKTPPNRKPSMSKLPGPSKTRYCLYTERCRISSLAKCQDFTHPAMSALRSMPRILTELVRALNHLSTMPEPGGLRCGQFCLDGVQPFQNISEARSRLTPPNIHVFCRLAVATRFNERSNRSAVQLRFWRPDASAHLYLTRLGAATTDASISRLVSRRYSRHHPPGATLMGSFKSISRACNKESVGWSRASTHRLSSLARSPLRNTRCGCSVERWRVGPRSSVVKR